MKTAIFFLLLLRAAVGQAHTQTNCLDKSHKAYTVVALLEPALFVPQNPITFLPETTEIAGEGDEISCKKQH